jgi:hypothetical protein
MSSFKFSTPFWNPIRIIYKEGELFYTGGDLRKYLHKN